MESPYRAQAQVEIDEEERLRAELEKKRAENATKEKAEAKARSLDALKRDIAIEDALSEAYAAGVKEEQIIELTWRGIGRCIARIPRDADWRDFAKRLGMLQGELKNDPAVHDMLAPRVMLVPNGKEFLELARERNPNAPFDLTNAVASAMRAERNERGK